MLTKKQQRQKGFTLIELLVVIAILGLLATIVAVSLTSARARARDARRVSDIRQIELALELYYAAHQEYPTSTPYTKLRNEGFLNMSADPADPKTGIAYCYASGAVSGTATHPTQYYHIGTELENSDSDMLCQDRDYNSASSSVAFTTQAGTDAAWCGTTGFNGGGTGTCAEGSNPIYDRGVLPQ